MIYEIFRSTLVVLVKAPSGPPELPAGDPQSVQVFRAAKNFLWYQLVGLAVKRVPALVFGLVIVFVNLVALLESGSSGTVGLWLFLGALLFVVGLFARYLMIRLDYDLRYYVVSDRSLRIREGAWRVDEATFTFANIQNLSIHQGPLERMFGIANLHVETAGGGNHAPQQGHSALRHRGVIRGVDNAQEIRDRIMLLLKHYRDAGLGDHGDRNLAPASAKVPNQATPGTSLSARAVLTLQEIRGEIRRIVDVVS